MADAYQILGVAKDATEEEIRSAHRSLARRWHPDRFLEGPERLWAEEKMIQINLAYEEVMKRCPIRHRGRIDKELEDIRRLLGENQLAQAR
ncbi:MAG: J domain-containing protein [Christensenellales bacterium]|jgi:molecular chaperone DnaJ